ncbi:MAG: MATE family efflux transporter [Planctomycetes bacterium]|nr:MATE family efflux transporter [Planctomycetota bacterium]
MPVDTLVYARPAPPKARRSLRREVWKLAWPVLLQNFFQTLILVTDSLMVGSLGKEALAAMGAAWPIYWSAQSLLAAIQVGTLALVARSVGEEDEGKTRANSMTALVLGLVCGLVFAAAGSWGAYAMAACFSHEPEVVHLSGLFLEISLLALPFTAFAMVATSILRGAGDTATPMWVSGSVNLLNILLNWLLIFGKAGCPALGIPGSALATFAAKAVEGAVLLGLLFLPRGPAGLRLGDAARIGRASMARFFRVTVPAMVEPLVLHSGFLVFSAMVAALGAASMAAHRIAVSIESLSFMPGFSFGIACSTLVGQALGARQPRAAELSCRETLRMAVLMMSALGLVYVAFPRQLARCYIDDPEVLSLVVTCLLIGALEQPFMGISMSLQGALRGAGDTKSTVYVAALGVWCVRVPGTWLVTRLGWGLPGVWVVALVDWSVRSAAYALLYRRGHWKRVAL